MVVCLRRIDGIGSSISFRIITNLLCIIIDVYIAYRVKSDCHKRKGCVEVERTFLRMGRWGHSDPHVPLIVILFWDGQVWVWVDEDIYMYGRQREDKPMT